MGRRKRKFRPWAADDFYKLRDLVGKKTTAEIAKELDRTKGAIIQRAFELRLSLRVKSQDDPAIESGENQNDGARRR